MNDGVTVSLLQMFERFPDAEAARLFIEERRWHGHVECPTCGSDKITKRGGKRVGYFRCRDCKDEFTVRTGTIFERSHVPLHKWLYAIYMVVTARKGISSMQLSKELSVTQATAWFMLQRIREACAGDGGKLAGIVEADETYVGGKERNKHGHKKLRAGRGTIGKTVVLGLRERGGGRSVAAPIAGITKATIHKEVMARVEVGSELHTDELKSYDGLTGLVRKFVTHGRGNYVGPGNVHCNSVESMWAVLKRGLYGTWHKASAKHLHRYVNEATFRLNEGNVRINTMDRIGSLLDFGFTRRLTYRNLVG